MRDQKEYDLRLGKFGPYNKEYLGVCHIADEREGSTFQVELFPGFFRRNVITSHAVCDNGLKMWGANVDLTHFVYRYEMEWKDRVYCDADFVITADRQCDITCTFVNNTEMSQTVNLNLCASLQYPSIRKGGEFAGYKKRCRTVLPQGCVYIDAVDYDHICCSQKLASDGKYLGESECRDATGYGTVISGKYFYDSHHFLRYELKDTVTDKIGIRYLAKAAVTLKLLVNEKEYKIRLSAVEDFGYVCIETERCTVKSVELREPDNAVTIDCLCIGTDVNTAVFEDIDYHMEPERILEDSRLVLSYPGVEHRYMIEWYEPLQMVRKLYCDDPAVLLARQLHDHVSDILKSGRDSERIYENLFTAPVFLAPGEHRSLRFCIICETQGIPKAPLREIYHVDCNSDGKEYAFSQNMMAYNTLLNVVYPVYTRRRFIRHNTPGRNWDSLYSWDSGFIGMGLAVMDFERAYDCLYTYLTPVNDLHSPYIFHGSVVPTQIFLYNELISSYPERKGELAELYPMMKQYYQFYACLDRTPEQMKSGLLNTWHIFYNSGGWDDYPAQLALLHKDADQHVTTPVITTAVTVLIAKIMKRIAIFFGKGDEADEYELDIEKYTRAIQDNLWDDEAGYFSYMVHDNEGRPKRFFRYLDGTNYNMGFDGIYPYIAGICTRRQKKKIFENIQKGLMTDIGIGAVDRRAPYYSVAGYWNGSVWMPHQWILWKALFDLGEMSLAFEIAAKALSVWKREVDETYSCFEHFMTVNGRGSGFHQFSGLSTPVLMFFAAYYSPGTITAGFETTIADAAWNAEKTEVSFYYTASGENPYIQICLKEGNTYSFFIEGKQIPAVNITKGAYLLPLIRSNELLQLHVK